jgi:eukaryotic-like serine/threonine-protein kinase
VTADIDNWIGREIAQGRYEVLARIGQGSMGQVYLAHDRNLGADVVLKFPVTAEKGSHGAEFLDRFAREIRSLVRLSHPHIVKVFDVGDWEGRPFVVMEYLAGGSLKDRLTGGNGGPSMPMPLRSLTEWLTEIAKALDFIHAQQHIHRDVKPANILFDRHGNAYLGDFGIIKALATEDEEWRGNSLTAPGFLVGTPNYVAPEIVMGRSFDGRVDQYSLAMTVHEVLSGINCMEGPTPSATVVNQTMVVPPALTELLPGVPSRLSDAILRGLSKDPNSRFPNCVALAHAILTAVPTAETTEISIQIPQPTSRGVPGRVPCPACQAPMPVGREHAGGRVSCTRCQATSVVSVLSSNTVQLKLVDPPTSTDGLPSSVVVSGPDEETEPDSSAATVLVKGVATEPARHARKPPGRRTMWVGLASLGVLALVGAEIARELSRRPPTAPTDPPGPQAAIAAGAAGLPAAPLSNDAVEINVAYGTEKQQWLEAATAEFAKTPAGRDITVNLHGMGSMEGARAVIDGPKPIPIHVWSPASSAYRDVFEQQWQAKHHHPPIQKAGNLALTPMVFVMWRSRHEPFLKKFQTVNFQNVGAAMQQAAGWGGIANKPDWGRFKFGHTHPNQSNSGLLTLVLMAYEFARKDRNLSHSDVAEAGFQEWFRGFEKGVTRPGGALTSSTGTLMREMVLRGPSQYDCVLIYENLAIEYLNSARDRWGELEVDYPDPNIWNEHPYYILDVPWSDAHQRAAAAALLSFLMSAPIQERALEHGFRPGNPAVSVRFPESPFIRNAKHGVRIDLPRMCEPPKQEIVQDLVDAFRRADD